MAGFRKRRQRLETMGVLAAGLAHEVKNPLSTVSVNLQLLAEDFADPKTPREERTLRRAKLLLGEVKRLDTIVNDFLSLARGYEVTPSSVDLELLITGLLRLLEDQNERLGIRTRSSLGQAARHVVADPKYLRMALMNLVLNAQQSMAESGGEMIVETRRRGRDVEIRITDTGPGIARDRLERIWQPWFSTKEGGTGLGLPTTRRIIEALGGDVTVFSELGRGTRFTVIIPGLPKQLPAGESGTAPQERDT
jgi:two-component system sensor histidine kinase HydH